MPGREPAPSSRPYKTAVAYRFRWFYVIESWIASAGSVLDPEGIRLRLDLDASPEELGAAVKRALEVSRFMQGDSPLYGRLFDAALQMTPDEVAAPFLEMAPVKTRHSLYRDAKSCGLRLQDGRIEIMPTKRAGPGGWVGLHGVEPLCISEASDAAEIGRALLRAFDLAR